MDVREARDLFERELPRIESLLASVARRYGLAGDDADGFASFARFRIMDDDYRVLRQFSGRSSLSSYLAVVVANLYRDFRIRSRGKWRPSAAARRRGPAAVLLDACINRDGHSLEEAVRRIASRDDVTEDEAALRSYAAELPRRASRTFVDVERLQLTSPERTDDPLAMREREAWMDTARAALDDALRELPEQDQVILRLRFWEGLTVANIARTLGIAQKPLYRRIEANLDRLRSDLEHRGVDGRAVAEMVAS